MSPTPVTPSTLPTVPLRTDETYVLEGEDGSRAFDATALESDLRNMWKRVGGDATKTGAIYRAALANLVVPLDPGLARRLNPVLVEVTRRHPSRLFTIQAGSTGARPGLRARVGALCHRRESGGGLVCSEQVVVESDGASSSLLPSAIRSLLIGDLPTVLLDFQPGLGIPWISELMDMADLVLEDSCIKESGREPEVWRLVQREGSRKVHDLAWARLMPWREILAEVFDERDYLPALGSIRRVEIRFTGNGPPPPPTWLLAGWLVSRLGWKVEGGNRGELALRSETGPVVVALRELGEGEGRVLERIHIRADGTHPLDLEIAHHGRDRTAEITTRAPRVSSMDVPFAYREFAACIVSEVHRHSENRPLEDAIRTTEALLRAWEGA